MSLKNELYDNEVPADFFLNEEWQLGELQINPNHRLAICLKNEFCWFWLKQELNDDGSFDWLDVGLPKEKNFFVYDIKSWFFWLNDFSAIYNSETKNEIYDSLTLSVTKIFCAIFNSRDLASWKSDFIDFLDEVFCLLDTDISSVNYQTSNSVLLSSFLKLKMMKTKARYNENVYINYYNHESLDLREFYDFFVGYCLILLEYRIELSKTKFSLLACNAKRENDNNKTYKSFSEIFNGGEEGLIALLDRLNVGEIKFTKYESEKLVWIAKINNADAIIATAFIRVCFDKQYFVKDIKKLDMSSTKLGKLFREYFNCSFSDDYFKPNKLLNISLDKNSKYYYDLIHQLI